MSEVFGSLKLEIERERSESASRTDSSRRSRPSGPTFAGWKFTTNAHIQLKYVLPFVAAIVQSYYEWLLLTLVAESWRK
jgi:hypothetical protein